MKRLILAVPSSHAWLTVQTCLSSLKRNPPIAEGIEAQIIVCDNSWEWSPCSLGITQTGISFGNLRVVRNTKGNKFHASALDHIIDTYDFDYLMAWETDVLALRPDWLQWFVDQIGDDNYAVGHWHHEQFVNPSCTLYRGDVLREFAAVCKRNTENVCRWGDNFEQTHEMDPGNAEWVAGAFAEKRGWPQGTQLVTEPTGKRKGPGWYEPGQALHHWAVNEGYPYKVCDTATTELLPGLPTQTFYGLSLPFERDLTPDEMFACGAYTVHLWGGTRSLDIIKHPTAQDEFNLSHVNFWQQREARFWQAIVPAEVQAETIELMRRYGWHTKGQGTPEVTERDREAGRSVEANYRAAGMPI